MYQYLILSSIGVVTIVYLYLKSSKPRNDKTITIVVLGDLGRSPRMMRHSISFADHDWSVNILAYLGTKLPTNLSQHKNIRFIALSEPPSFISTNLPGYRYLFVLLIGPIKALYLSINLLYTLLRYSQNSSYVMVQNPPAIPTLPIVQIGRFILRYKLIIDWHNTAYSILALKLGSEKHPMVRVSKIIESFFGKKAHLHLFVTEAERIYLSKIWNLQGKTKVFYDRPPVDFCRLTVDQIHQFWNRLPINQNPNISSTFYPSDSSPNFPLVDHQTLITLQKNDEKSMVSSISFRPNRPALIISSTSWTHDEDFNILINALSIYTQNKRKHSSNQLPGILCLITGKGPLKNYYHQEILKREREEHWSKEKVRCELVWLEDLDDYKKLLGSCDLGISLHQSSSGLDLPMKVVDMFGCGLTVCARNFACISELVQHDKNGLVFNTDLELATQLEDLLMGFPNDQSTDCKLNRLKSGILCTSYGVDGDRWTDWDQDWEKHVLKTI